MHSSISIVIVTWNSRPDLERNHDCLLRLHEELGADIIIVENASGDGVEEFVWKQMPWARFISNPENFGFGRACNIGARIAQSEFLLFLNPDASIDPANLSMLCQALSSDAKVAMAGPAIRNSRGGFYPSAHRDPNAINYWPTHSCFAPLWRKLRASQPRAAVSHTDWLMGACILVRRKAFEQAGGFPEAYFLYSEDAELCWNLRRLDWKILFVPQAICRHEHAQSARQDSQRTFVELFRSLKIYGQRCQNERWINAMRRSILLDMALRKIWIRIVRRDNQALGAVGEVERIWKNDQTDHS